MMRKNLVKNLLVVMVSWCHGIAVSVRMYPPLGGGVGGGNSGNHLLPLKNSFISRAQGSCKIPERVSVLG